jgi:mannosyl-oligosaccharide alpha-1,2-mannosidase
MLNASTQVEDLLPAALPGRQDLTDLGMLFWYDLLNMQSFDGLYCVGIGTERGECGEPKMSVGSAADSMYEYMLKQWLLSNKTQEVRVGW